MGNKLIRILCCCKKTHTKMKTLQSHEGSNNINSNNHSTHVDNVYMFNLPNETKNYNTYFNKEQLEYYENIYKSEANKDVKYINRQKLKIGSMIGKGNYSSVFQCLNTDDGTMIALKKIDLNEITNDSNSNSNSNSGNGNGNGGNNDNSYLIQQAAIEVDLLIHLHHKNIIDYYGVYYTQNQYLDIYLELCAGGSLMTLYKQFTNFDEKLIRRYTIQILKGVEYLHSKNIVHGDIKCSNILIDREGICKLSDFGCSKLIKSHCNILSNSKYNNRTMNWFAPEVVKGEISRYSDIWSIGCTVIEMLQGCPLWSECTESTQVNEMLFNIKKVTNLIPTKASFTLRDFLKKCLVIEPTKRWNVNQLLKHPFITQDSMLDVLDVIDVALTEPRNDVHWKEKSFALQRDDSLILATPKTVKMNMNMNQMQCKGDFIVGEGIELEEQEEEDKMENGNGNNNGNSNGNGSS